VKILVLGHGLETVPYTSLRVAHDKCGTVFIPGRARDALSLSLGRPDPYGLNTVPYVWQPHFFRTSVAAFTSSASTAQVFSTNIEARPRYLPYDDW